MGEYDRDFTSLRNAFTLFLKEKGLDEYEFTERDFYCWAQGRDFTIKEAKRLLEKIESQHRGELIK